MVKGGLVPGAESQIPFSALGRHMQNVQGKQAWRMKRIEGVTALFLQASGPSSKDEFLNNWLPAHFTGLILSHSSPEDSGTL